jgi:hypothetical protein
MTALGTGGRLARYLRVTFRALDQGHGGLGRWLASAA